MLRKLGHRLIGLVAIAALGGSGTAFPAGATTGDWNQYQHDAAHTGSSPALGPTRPAVLPGWPVACGHCTLGPVVAQVGATALGPQPAVLTGSDTERKVFAFDSHGRPLPGSWPAQLEQGFSEGAGFPAVDTTTGNARIFATGSYSNGTDTGSVYALDAEARPLPGAWPWRDPAGTRIDHTPPTLVEGTQGDASDTTVYQAYRDNAAWGDGHLTALGADGSTKPGWPVRFDGGVPLAVGGSPAVGPDGTVYVVLDQPVGGTAPWYRSVRVDAYAPDGTHKSGWPVNLGEGESASSMYNPPVVSGDGTVYVSVFDPQVDDDNRLGWIYAIAPNGQVKPGWPVRTHGAPLFTPVLAKDGSVYVSTFWTDTDAGLYESYVYSLDAAGRTRPGWPVRLEFHGDFLTGWEAAIYGMASDAASNIYFASLNTVYGYRPDGTALPGWPLQLAPDRVLRYPALGSNGVLYAIAGDIDDLFVFTDNRELYAIGNSKLSPRPAKKRPVPRKKKIDDFTATPGADAPSRAWLVR